MTGGTDLASSVNLGSMDQATTLLATQREAIAAEFKRAFRGDRAH